MNLHLIFVSLIILVFNIPFGYWRGNVKKLSLQWFLAVHIPVPFIIALRIFDSLGYAWYTYVLFVGAFFLGQSFGAYLQKRKKQLCNHTTSCLIMDLLRNEC